MASVEELQKDLELVNELLARASRKRVCDILLSEQRKLEAEISNRRHLQQPTGETSEPQKPSAIVAPITSGYTVKINNYGWDQSDKFVKIYVTLNGVQQVPAENVEVHFTERSFELLVKDLEGKNYSLIINNLLRPISAEGSSRKIKTDRVLVMCRKKAEQKWEYLTQVEKQTKEKDKPSLNTEGVQSEDPSDGLMNVLKKIYESGDDEIRRNINKAWVESREKQGKGDMDF